MKKKLINSRLFTFTYDQNQEKFKNQVFELIHKYYSEENNANFFPKRPLRIGKNMANCKELQSLKEF